MEQQILTVLRTRFPDVDVEISLEPTTGRYNGRILSVGFDGLSFVDRQRNVFDLLRQTLGPDTQQISMLFTYTPAEYEQLQAA